MSNDFVPMTTDEITRVSERLGNSTERFTTANLDRVQISKDGIFSYMQNGQKQIQQDLSGIVINASPIRRYIIGSGDESQYICTSDDGMKGWGDPKNTGGIGWNDCETCPMNQWGSGNGRSKACREKRRLLIMLSGARLPRVMEIPTTSLPNWGSFMLGLFDAGHDLEEVVTHFSLFTKTQGGNQYSIVNFAFNDVLDAEQKRLYFDLRGSINNMLGNGVPANRALNPNATASLPQGDSPAETASVLAGGDDYSEQENIPAMDINFVDQQ